MTAQVAVVHLARCANGIEPLLRFLESYAMYAAGMAHRLIVVLKGFEQDAAMREAATRALPANIKVLEIPDVGFDLDAYRAAFEAFEYNFFCFLNSFSCIKASGWLAMLMHWAAKPNVGIVGATGSYQSVFADEVHALIGAFVHYLALCWHSSKRPKSFIVLAPIVAWGLMPAEIRGRFFRQAPARLWRARRNFPAFPNYHIRTNAFLLRKSVLARLHWPALPDKYAAYRLESGRDSITAQIIRLGLEPVVVGKDAKGYFRDQWHASGTFWQGDQANLLIEDNQTREYGDGSEPIRARLRRYAWRNLCLAGEG
jgi:hypothetical protein